MMLSSRRLALALVLAFAAALSVARPVVALEGAPMILPVDPAPLTVETKDGERRFTVEIAADDSERSAGLMFRTEMDDDHGMLFVFERERRLSFWMKNTPMPLDLVFIDGEGAIVDILPGEPFSLAPIGPEAPARFVLELKAGTAEKAGIAQGDRVRHPRIDGAPQEE
jgi:uncharacterized membrane protein (UPF0127 family)